MHHCQTDGREDQMAGKERRLTKQLVDAMDTHTGRDSAVNCQESVTYNQLACSIVTARSGN